jgi:hypothetical protein
MPSRTLILVAVFLPTITASGQSVWPGDSPGTVGLRLAKSIVTADNGPGLATFTAVATGRFALTPRVTAEAEVSLARATGESGSGGESISGTALGNPYVGIEVPVGSATVQAGLRLGVAPVADGPGELDAQLYAILSEFDRFEAFMPKTSAARVLVGVGRAPSAGGFVQGRFGATAMKSDDTDVEVFLDYGGRIGYRGSGMMGYGGVLGRAILTSGEGSFSDRTIHMLSAGAAAVSGRARPQAELRYYLDEGTDDARIVVALGMVVDL